MGYGILAMAGAGLVAIPAGLAARWLLGRFGVRPPKLDLAMLATMAIIGFLTVIGIMREFNRANSSEGRGVTYDEAAPWVPYLPPEATDIDYARTLNHASAKFSLTDTAFEAWLKEHDANRSDLRGECYIDIETKETVYPDWTGWKQASRILSNGGGPRLLFQPDSGEAILIWHDH